MNNIFLFILGLMAGSFIAPCFYFVMVGKGGIRHNEDDAVFICNLLWAILAGLIIIISIIVFSCLEVINIPYIAGIFMGICTSILSCIYMLSLSIKGMIIRIRIEISKLQNTIDNLSSCHKTCDQEYTFKELRAKREKAEQSIAALYIKQGNKSVAKIKKLINDEDF